MNDKLKKLDYKKMIVVDCETVKGLRDFNKDHPFFEVYAHKSRNKLTNEHLSEEEVIKHYNSNAPLYPEWGKIVCISVGFITDAGIRVKSFYGDDEKQILSDFVALVKKHNFTIVGHNIIGFDIPYIRKRFFINGLTDYLSDKQGNDVYMKPWLLDECLMDTMVAWKGSSFHTTSLDELCMLFGIDSSKNGAVSGQYVSQFYYDGKIEDIKEYCEADIVATSNLLRVWKGDPIVGKLEISVDPSSEPEPANILESIISKKDIEASDIEIIQSKTSKANNKEKEIVVDIVKSLAIQEQEFLDSGVVQADSKAVKEFKTKQAKSIYEKD